MKGKVYSGSLQIFYIAAWKGNEKSCLDIHAFIFFSPIEMIVGYIFSCAFICNVGFFTVGFN